MTKVQNNTTHTQTHICIYTENEDNIMTDYKVSLQHFSGITERKGDSITNTSVPGPICKPSTSAPTPKKKIAVVPVRHFITGVSEHCITLQLICDLLLIKVR
jgi:hypothetical protein